MEKLKVKDVQAISEPWLSVEKIAESERAFMLTRWQLVSTSTCE